MLSLEASYAIDRCGQHVYEAIAGERSCDFSDAAIIRSGETYARKLSCNQYVIEIGIRHSSKHTLHLFFYDSLLDRMEEDEDDLYAPEGTGETAAGEGASAEPSVAQDAAMKDEDEEEDEDDDEDEDEDDSVCRTSQDIFYFTEHLRTSRSSLKQKRKSPRMGQPSTLDRTPIDLHADCLVGRRASQTSQLLYG